MRFHGTHPNLSVFCLFDRSITGQTLSPFFCASRTNRCPPRSQRRVVVRQFRTRRVCSSPHDCGLPVHHAVNWSFQIPSRHETTWLQALPCTTALGRIVPLMTLVAGSFLAGEVTASKTVITVSISSPTFVHSASMRLVTPSLSVRHDVAE